MRQICGLIILIDNYFKIIATMSKINKVLLYRGFKWVFCDVFMETLLKMELLEGFYINFNYFFK